MTIDWNAFAPGLAAIGGGLIGIAAALLVLFNGRLAAVSGILSGMLKPGPDFGWRAAFVLGMLAAPALWALAGPLPEVRIDAEWPALVAAGLLVGIGTRYCSGCTSGHGVCGLSRLSPRSMVATLAFMSAGFVTVFVIRHVL